MKTSIKYRLICLVFLMASWIVGKSQNQAEVPGDNFSLEGALELFKESSSPKEFEKMLNSSEAKVNNLDLNGDGYIDYIKVIDMQDGNVHAFVMQAVIAENQFQDIAVITLEKQGNGKAILQITGDEDIYGVETIIEPTREVRTYAGAMSSNVHINVWSWPVVRYVYGPHYSGWVSPWRWGYRPIWWSPWRPIVYVDYFHFWRPYRRFYTPCYTTRIVHAYNNYRVHRTTSVIVHNRYNQSITQYRSRHIGRNGRYQASNGRGRTVRSATSARYDSNGRIVSGGRSTSRSSANVNRRSSSQTRQGSKTAYDNRSSNSRTAGNERRYSTGSNARESSSRSAGTNNVRRSTDYRSTDQSSVRSNERRSTGSSNMRQSSDDSRIERSTGSSYRNSSATRSSRSSGIQRSSSSRSSRNSGIQQRSTSSRSSGIQRSSGRSSRSPGIQRSSSSSRSSGILRSSGRSGSSPRIRNSSGRSSGSSATRSSGGSSRSSRSRSR